MISANTFPTTIVRFAENLPAINIWFARTNQCTDAALHNAFAKFEKGYGNRSDSFFNEFFLATDGADIISRFAANRVARHDASVRLARAWVSHLSPARSAVRKRRIIDATMAADSLLSCYEAELAVKKS